MESLNDFLWGSLSMACIAIGVCFLRFWRNTQDRFFLFFSLAFWALGINWLSLGIFQPSSETHHYFYLLRMLAFLLILAGILDKNFVRRR